MPIYSYKCLKCGNHSEIIHKVSDSSQHMCELCEGELERTISPVAVIFKGSGFHKNDYAHGSSPVNPAKVASDSNNTESKSEIKPEVKSEAKQETSSSEVTKPSIESSSTKSSDSTNAA